MVVSQSAINAAESVTDVYAQPVTPCIAMCRMAGYDPAVGVVNQCNLCDQPDSFSASSETASVRSNIREFMDESFTVWRCGSCRSIHAREIPDLAHYYAKYPFHNQRLDWSTKKAYANLAGRLIRAGLTPSHAILDHGCGSGLLIRYL